MGAHEARSFRPKMLYRKRINKILEGIFKVPLFVLVSPMGYGKTTAVSSFLHSKENLCLVWFTLSSGENDELWTWWKFCQSLESVEPDLSQKFANYGLPQTAVDIDRILQITE